MSHTHSGIWWRVFCTGRHHNKQLTVVKAPSALEATFVASDIFPSLPPERFWVMPMGRPARRSTDNTNG
jgi:hypothetical protein